MTQDDVLFGYRLQLFDLAARTSVSHACRMFGVHRSTYYRWKRQVDRSGLEMLRPRERRRPQMPNQLRGWSRSGSSRSRSAHPGLGPRRVAAELARPKWGGLVVSPNGVYKTLRRHGLNTRAKRLALVAGYRAPYEPPREPAPEPHIDIHRPGRAGRHRLLLRRPAARHQRRRSGRSPRSTPTARFAWADLVVCPAARPRPSSRPAARPPRRRRTPGRPAGGSSACSPTTATSSAAALRRTRSTGSAPATPASAPGARRPTATSNALHRTILEECWRPAFARYLQARFTRPATRPRRLPALSTTTTAPTHGRHHPRPMPRRPRLRCPKDGAQMSRTCRHISESVQPKARGKANAHHRSERRQGRWPEGGPQEYGGLGYAVAVGGCRSGDRPARARSADSKELGPSTRRGRARP